MCLWRISSFMHEMSGSNCSSCQAEEHAQICNMNQDMNPEVQQGPKNIWDAATSGANVSSDQNKTAIQGAPTGGLQAYQITPADNLNQPAMANPQPQALPAMVMSTSQWYQSQFKRFMHKCTRIHWKPLSHSIGHLLRYMGWHRARLMLSFNPNYLKW